MTSSTVADVELIASKRLGYLTEDNVECDRDGCGRTPWRLETVRVTYDRGTVTGDVELCDHHCHASEEGDGA